MNDHTHTPTRTRTALCVSRRNATGRKSAFKSAAERDKHLQKQLGELEAAVKERERQLARARQEREAAAKQVRRGVGVGGV